MNLKKKKKSNLKKYGESSKSILREEQGKDFASYENRIREE